MKVNESWFECTAQYPRDPIVVKLYTEEDVIDFVNHHTKSGADVKVNQYQMGPILISSLMHMGMDPSNA